MTPRNEFDGSERPSAEQLIQMTANFVDTIPEDSEDPGYGVSPPADDESRAFREGLLVELRARQEKNHMVTRAAVITNIEKSLE